MYDLATSILGECKGAAPFSDLETAIYLFREALARCPQPHSLQLDSFKDLAAALLTRFSFTNNREDLDEALTLFCQAGTQRIMGIGQVSVCTRSHSDLIVSIYNLRRQVRLLKITGQLRAETTQKDPS